MSLIRALLWLLLAVLLFGVVVVVFFPGGKLSGLERLVSTAIMLVLATPLVMQLRTLRARTRERNGNRIELDREGAWIKLDGAWRAGKGLPAIAQTRLPWSEIKTITHERRKFVYPSLIPFEYPLEVYTIAAGIKIPFTRECVAHAARIAAEVAERLRVS